jgi:hypothetical protein
MKKTTILLVVVLLCIGVLAGLRAAIAGKACVAYKVTAPFVGTRQGKPCVPDPFSHTFTVYHCEAVPSSGVSACATISADTP